MVKMGGVGRNKNWSLSERGLVWGKDPSFAGGKFFVSRERFIWSAFSATTRTWLRLRRLCTGRGKYRAFVFVRRGSAARREKGSGVTVCPSRGREERRRKDVLV